MKKAIVLLGIALLILFTASAFSVTAGAKSTVLDDYDLRAGVLPNGWTIEYIIDQSAAENAFEKISARYLKDGVNCYIDWSVYLVGYNVSFAELQGLKTLRDLPRVLDGNDCCIYLPIFADLEENKRIVACLKITHSQGEFCCNSSFAIIDERFLSGEHEDFWCWLGYVDQVNPAYIPIDQGQYSTLVMVNISPMASCANYSELLLGYNDCDGWMVHDHSNRSWLDLGVRVSPLEEFVAEATAYEASVHPSEDNVRLMRMIIVVLCVFGLLLILSVGMVLYFLIRAFVRKLKRCDPWEGGH